MDHRTCTRVENTKKQQMFCYSVAAVVLKQYVWWQSSNRTFLESEALWLDAGICSVSEIRPINELLSIVDHIKTTHRPRSSPDGATDGISGSLCIMLSKQIYWNICASTRKNTHCVARVGNGAGVREVEWGRVGSGGRGADGYSQCFVLVRHRPTPEFMWCWTITAGYEKCPATELHK